MEKEWLFKVGLGLLVFLVVFMAGFYSALTGSFFHNTLPGSSLSSSSSKISSVSPWYGTGNCGAGFKCSEDGTLCYSGSQKKYCANGYHCETVVGATTCFKNKEPDKEQPPGK